MEYKTNLDDAIKLATVRKELIQSCESLPQVIRTHRGDAIGHVSLTIGKCFLWVGGILDNYSTVQPLPGTSLPRISDLGEQLRLLGLEILHEPGQGELKRTIATLQRQVELLQQLAERGAQ